MNWPSSNLRDPFNQDKRRRLSVILTDDTLTFSINSSQHRIQAGVMDTICLFKTDFGL